MSNITFRRNASARHAEDGAVGKSHLGDLLLRAHPAEDGDQLGRILDGLSGLVDQMVRIIDDAFRREPLLHDVRDVFLANEMEFLARHDPGFRGVHLLFLVVVEALPFCVKGV